MLSALDKTTRGTPVSINPKSIPCRMAATFHISKHKLIHDGWISRWKEKKRTQSSCVQLLTSFFFWDFFYRKFLTAQESRCGWTLHQHILPNFLLISRVFVPKAWIVPALVAEHTLCCKESLLAVQATICMSVVMCCAFVSKSYGPSWDMGWRIMQAKRLLGVVWLSL